MGIPALDWTDPAWTPCVMPPRPGSCERVWCLSPDRLARAYAYQVLVLDELDRFGVAVVFTDSPGLAADDPQSTLLTQVQGVIAEYEKAKIAERYRRGKLFRPAPARSSPGRLPTATAALPAAPPPAKHTTRSTNPRPRWCGGSSPTAPSVSPCVRSVAGSTPTQYPHRPASQPGAIPPSAGCCATRPTSAGSTTTAPNRCPTGAPPAATDRSRATATNGSRSTAPASSPTSCSCRRPMRHRQHQWSPRRAVPGQWLLKGLVKCGVCGVGTNCHKMRGRNGTWHRYYYCRNHDPLRAGGESHRCPERNIRADALDAFVFDHIRAALTHPDQLLAGEQAVTLHNPDPRRRTAHRRTGPPRPQDRRRRHRTAPPHRPLPGRVHRTARNAAPRHRGLLPPKRAAAQANQPRRRTNRAGPRQPASPPRARLCRPQTSVPWLLSRYCQWVPQFRRPRAGVAARSVVAARTRQPCAAAAIGGRVNRQHESPSDRAVHRR